MRPTCLLARATDGVLVRDHPPLVFGGSGNAGSNPQTFTQAATILVASSICPGS